MCIECEVYFTALALIRCFVSFFVLQGMNVAVAGIPKTIDNDIDYIDKSFGFNTAVEASQLAIRKYSN